MTGIEGETGGGDGNGDGVLTKNTKHKEYIISLKYKKYVSTKENGTSEGEEKNQKNYLYMIALFSHFRKLYNLPELHLCTG